MLAETVPPSTSKLAESLPSPRWELLCALGVLAALPPPDSGPIVEALGLTAWSRAEHTRLFVMELVPSAAIHLGAEGKLGGDGAEAVAGFWRALGLQPPSEPDRLDYLVGLYAELGHATETCRTEAARRRLDHAMGALLTEHIWSWLPGYLSAVGSYPSGAEWAELMLQALSSEIRAHNAVAPLPVALRDAPAPLDVTVGYDELLDSLTAPVRMGFILTHSDLEEIGRQLGIGVRRGERRYILKAMLEQAPGETLASLAQHARRWSLMHARQPVDTPAGAWWQERAATSAVVLDRLAGNEKSRGT
jgi:TorA maturation chaperone TorD